VVLFVHGAGMDSTVWQLQTRWFACHGYRAVAVDLPGHGGSEGTPLATIEQMADWVTRFVAAAGFESAHVVAHSMGTFVALELASRRASIIASLTLCGTATTMPVHPDLVEAAEHDLPAAAALMASWGHAQPAHVGGNPTPGLWMLGCARALVERSAPGVLATDFRACMAYSHALDAAAAVTCRCTVIVGLGDKMTPPKAGRALAAALGPHANSSFRRVVELPGTGHSMMTEQPHAMRRAIAATIAD
jgi:pimeloyl-ACP methyl ester carboxylesterase